MNIKNKKISILGAVRSGVAAAKLAKTLGAIPFVSDTASEEKLYVNLKILEHENIKFEINGHSENVFDADLIVTSPGVPSDSEVIKKASKNNIPVISEIEFASGFCKGKIVAITGTNGKTTTTSLTSFALKKTGNKVYTAGNIGLAFSEIALLANEDDYVVLEISSFQLDFVESFKPFISVLLNVTPDHLNRYENNFEKYKNSKAPITLQQTADEYFIYNNDDENIPLAAKESLATKYLFSTKNKVCCGTYFLNNNFIYSENQTEEYITTAEEVSLRGEHNYSNICAVITILKLLKIENEIIISALKEFPGVEHRLEFVRELDGVKYINDSKATNVDAVWYALQSFSEPINLILGGTDKGNDYNKIKNVVIENVKKIYAIGASAEKVFTFFSKFKPVIKVESFEECLLLARKEAVEGEIVLLSPACASFDMFNSYEHRGKVFKKLVRELD